MINRQQLLSDLRKFFQRIEADLLERSKSTEVPEIPAALHAEYDRAAKAERTAQNYEDWRTDTITQAAAAWVLSSVFVRFLEDNSLIDPPKIAGPGERLARARDEHELYFRSHPQHTDREYLLSIFGELAKLPGTKGIFGEHNAINDLPNWLSGDAAGELLNLFQKIDASTGVLVHDFTDPNWDTRFLGDLYQDLSEAARKKFALLQTPDFVEEFILDRTLDPAIEEFGLGSCQLSVVRDQSKTDNRQLTTDNFRMIDPACGSGHFLLGAFRRIVDRWEKYDPEAKCRVVVQRALDSIYGVDINPFAVAIARFRLLLAALKECGVMRLSDAPGFRVHVACGDSLLHGENRTSTGQKSMDFADGATDEELYSHAYPGEDLQTVRALLKPNSYHCVVANPPYIVPNDRKLNDWYRRRFSACHMKYSLAVTFMQLIFNLAIRNVQCSVLSVQSEGKTENRKLKTENSCAAGFTGQITANSFMKREFGKKLIESFFPTVDLTHVIDTSGAYIPGHGTPTTILFGRHREAVASTASGGITLDLVVHEASTRVGYEPIREKLREYIRDGLSDEWFLSTQRTSQAVAARPVVAGRYETIDFYLSQRNSPPLYGLGLIDKIPIETLKTIASRQRFYSSGKISGRVGTGKFGWRAQTDSLLNFVRGACAGELGLSQQRLAQPIDPADLSYRNAGVDISDEQCQQLASFIAKLPAPTQDLTSDERRIRGGRTLFHRIGCARCHVPNVPPAENLYGDLLLHDMGNELQAPSPAPTGLSLAGSKRFVVRSVIPRDSLFISGNSGSEYYGSPSDRYPIPFALERPTEPQFPRGEITDRIWNPVKGDDVYWDALQREWRTPPLWGVADSGPYLHDGRASTIDQAIRLHGGEAAETTEAYVRLSLPNREKILTFLKSLVAPKLAVRYAIAIRRATKMFQQVQMAGIGDSALKTCGEKEPRTL